MTDKNNDSLNLEKTIDGRENSLGNEKTLPGGAVCGVVDRYELIEKLGQGGFGAVYRARDTEAGVEVALKALPPLISHSPDEMQSVRANFALVSKLVHSGIANLKHLHKVERPDDATKKALGVSSGDYLVVMEYVPGSTLSAWRTKFPNKQVPVFQALEICRQIAEALDYAHAQKIIHRDIKPSNIMVGGQALDLRPEAVGQTESPKDQSLKPMAFVKVLDFGLAAEIRSSMSRVSQEQGDSSGTRPYMAPEQWTGRRQGAQTDQYALAVLFYELVSGAVPFQSVFETGDMQLMRDVVKTEAIEPLEELDVKQNGVLLRALSKEPQERFATCGDFVAALSGGKISKPRNTRKNRSPRETQKITKGVLVGVCAIAIMGAVYLSYSSYTFHQAAKAEAARVAQLEQEKQEQIAGLLKAAQEQFDKEQYAEASDAVAQVLGLDVANATAQHLQDQIEKKVGSAQVALMKAQALKAWDEVKNYDRGQGFGGKLDAIKLKLDTALDLFDNQRDSNGAYAYFRDTLSECASLKILENDREDAKKQRALAGEQQKLAKEAKADELAKDKWQESLDTASKAAQGFEDGKFAEASNGWKTASEKFHAAQAFAKQMVAYLEAETEWLQILKLNGIDVPRHGFVKLDNIKTYDNAAWKQANALAINAEKMRHNPSEGMREYLDAIKILKLNRCSEVWVSIDARWEKRADGLVMRDRDTGLIWLYAPHSIPENQIERNMRRSLQWCENFVYAGITDWRLPTPEELKAVQSQQDKFDGIKRREWYWTSKMYKDVLPRYTNWYADCVFMGRGNVKKQLLGDYIEYYVWPVAGETKRIDEEN